MDMEAWQFSPLFQPLELYMETHKFAAIEWIDAIQPTLQWEHVKDVTPPKNMLCHSVGWIVAESDEGIVVAAHIGDLESDDMQCIGHMTIPKSAIKEIRYKRFK
jgi:hypothetical protein